MDPLFLFIFSILLLFNPTIADESDGHISAIIFNKGLGFAKDLLIEQAVETLTPLQLPDIEKSTKIPFIGVVTMDATNMNLYQLNVSVSSSTVGIGDLGIEIVASGVTADMSMDWSYSYTTGWFVPIKISDSGNASVKVEGMEIGLTMKLKSQNGSLDLTVSDCSCYMEELIITLNGGASWFYQGFVNAFKNHIRSAVQKAMTEKIADRVTDLNYLLQKIPKSVNLDGISSFNLTLVHDPVYGKSSIEFDINGLFYSSGTSGTDFKTAELENGNQNSNRSFVPLNCGDESKMVLVSVDQAMFNSASEVYFQAGLMNWIVEKIPDQSLLNTSSWKFLVPQLYSKYPNDNMILNISINTPPVLKINSEKMSSSMYSDMIVGVLDGNNTVPIACIEAVVTVSGFVNMSGSNLTGEIELDSFTLTLKWSKVGNFYMSLIQDVINIFLNTVLVPFVNLILKAGFSLPSFYGFTLQDAYISMSDSMLVLCSDVAYTNSSNTIISTIMRYS